MACILLLLGPDILDRVPGEITGAPPGRFTARRIWKSPGVAHSVAIVAVPSEPGVLDHVLGLGDRAEHAVGEPGQPRPLCLEGVSGVGATPDAIQAMQALGAYVTKCGLEPGLLNLVKMRASQMNGCAFCLDMHSREARGYGNGSSGFIC